MPYSRKKTGKGETHLLSGGVERKKYAHEETHVGRSAPLKPNHGACRHVGLFGNWPRDQKPCKPMFSHDSLLTGKNQGTPCWSQVGKIWGGV